MSSRVSVIIPARNAASTIGRTLDSLLAQTDGDWHALVVDNNSTDATAAIAAEYRQRDARFSLLSGPGSGASVARNQGLAAASGRRILFLDSDDWIDPQFLSRMNAALDAHPAAVAAYCNYRRVLPDGEAFFEYRNPHVADAPFESFARSCCTAIHGVLFKRDLLGVIGDFDTSLRTCEDWDFWQRVARLGGAWVHVDEYLSYYRAGDGSLTANTAQMLADARIVIDRGFSSDERLGGPHPAHKNGAAVEGGTAESALGYLSLWCAAFTCGRGQRSGLSPADVSCLARENVPALATTLLEGFIVGSRMPARRLASQWPAFGARIGELIDELGRIWKDEVLARRLQYRFERLILNYDDLAAPRRLKLTLGQRIDLRRPPVVSPPAGVDRLYVYLCDGDDIAALLDIGVLGTMGPRDWLALAIEHVDPARLTKLALRALGPSFAARFAAHAAREAWCSLRAGARPKRADILARALRKSLPSERSHSPDSSHRARLAALQDAAAAKFPAAHASADAAPQALDKKPHGSAERQDYWEHLFEKVDPWNYRSAYEQEKYELQLQLVPASGIDRALELACAEGLFTRRLAPRVKHLVATDISNTALARAQEHCRDLTNIEFRQLDLVAHDVPPDFDLIICSEVLYYLDDLEELKRVAAKIRDGLKPGGRFIHAHACVLKDDMTRTGFDWGHDFGALKISEAFAACDGLALEKSIRTELYRIDCFRRVAGADIPAPDIRDVAMAATVEPDVARNIVWGGAAARRATLKTEERHDKIPVLMYHSVSDRGPAALSTYRVSPKAFHAQMKWLRSNGYHSLRADELVWFMENSHRFYGRPVVITFDDGLQDFADNAWPILRAHDFRAEMFVVTDRLGGVADWDASHGAPAPLMNAGTIKRLAAEGVRFGSHLATHRAAEGLSTQELACELAGSSARLRQLLDDPPFAFAAPYGLADERVRRLAAEFGFRAGFTTEPGAADLAAEPLRIPRINVDGAWTLQDFIARMEESR